MHEIYFIFASQNSFMEVVNLTFMIRNMTTTDKRVANTANNVIKISEFGVSLQKASRFCSAKWPFGSNIYYRWYEYSLQTVYRYLSLLPFEVWTISVSLQPKQCIIKKISQKRFTLHWFQYRNSYFEHRSVSENGARSAKMVCCYIHICYGIYFDGFLSIHNWRINFILYFR